MHQAHYYCRERVRADYPAANLTWYGITRRTLANLATGAPFSGGIGNSANATKNSFLPLETVATGNDASIRGMAATDSELYVADTYANRIVVFDANSMQRLRSWNVTSPGRIAVDTDSTLWVMSGVSSGSLTIQHYAANGAALAIDLHLCGALIVVIDAAHFGAEFLLLPLKRFDLSRQFF